MIKIYADKKLLTEAETVLLSPWDAPEYPDKFMGKTVQSDANAKHAYHALSQIAFFDYEDNILNVQKIPSDAPIIVESAGGKSEIGKGLVIARHPKGEVLVFVHEDQDLQSLLRFAHRYCTRWIRLDVR